MSAKDDAKASVTDRYPDRIFASNNGGPHRFWQPDLMHADEAAFCCEYVSIDAHKAALAKARNEALEEAATIAYLALDELAPPLHGAEYGMMSESERADARKASKAIEARAAIVVAAIRKLKDSGHA